MYIISKKSEKDYYDGVAGTSGIDKTIVYERHIQDIELKDVPILFKNRTYRRDGNSKNSISPLYRISSVYLNEKYKDEYYGISSFIIGFCGKLYPGWKLYKKVEKDYSYSSGFTTIITYDSDFIKEHIKNYIWEGNFDDIVKYVREFDATEVFRHFNAPSFVDDNDYGRKYDTNMNFKTFKFIVNPILKEYEFYKVFDSFQAFQEISMYIGGVLGNKEKGVIEVDDKYKIAQHGFDKWSFRKMPENKQ